MRNLVRLDIFQREVVLKNSSIPNTRNNENKQVHLRKDLLAATLIFSIHRKTLQIWKRWTSDRIKSLQAYMLCLSLLIWTDPFASLVYHLAYTICHMSRHACHLYPLFTNWHLHSNIYSHICHYYPLSMNWTLQSIYVMFIPCIPTSSFTVIFTGTYAMFIRGFPNASTSRMN